MSDLGHPSVELQIVPRVRDLGGFQVQRVLPSSRRKMVGPFIFLDQMGPAILQPGEGVDVRPHPHIGLATVTYLSAGEFLHRDSVGSIVTIRPGDVNWMTAGKGIAHSERTPGCARPAGGTISGVQLWVALPKAHEETDPIFAHHDRATLPTVEDRGASVRVVAGSFLGGEPMDGPRHIWWNFVSSSEERIEQARADWQAGRFRPISGEAERIPAPDGPIRRAARSALR